MVAARKMIIRVAGMKVHADGASPRSSSPGGLIAKRAITQQVCDNIRVACQCIIVITTIDDVVAIGTGNKIILATAINRVCLDGAGDLVIPILTINHIPADNGIAQDDPDIINIETRRIASAAIATNQTQASTLNGLHIPAVGFEQITIQISRRNGADEDIVIEYFQRLSSAGIACNIQADCQPFTSRSFHYLRHLNMLAATILCIQSVLSIRLQAGKFSTSIQNHL